MKNSSLTNYIKILSFFLNSKNNSSIARRDAKKTIKYKTNTVTTVVLLT